MSYEKRKWEKSVWPIEELPKEKPMKRQSSKTNLCDSCGYYRHIENGKTCARCKEFESKRLVSVKINIPKPKVVEEIFTQTTNSNDIAKGLVSFLVFLGFLWWAFTGYAVLVWLLIVFLMTGVLWIKQLILKQSLKS